MINRKIFCKSGPRCPSCHQTSSATVLKESGNTKYWPKPVACHILSLSTTGHYSLYSSSLLPVPVFTYHTKANSLPKRLSTTNILVFYGPPSLGNKKHYAYHTGKFSHPQSTRTQATHQWTYLRSIRCRCWHRRGRFLRRREYSGPTPCDTLDRAWRHTAWTTSRLGRCLVSVTAQHCSHVSQHNTG